MQSKHWYGLILAGGSGTRLYPHSREDRPKQFLKILGKRTLVQQTFNRLKQVLPIDHIYVATNQKYLSEIKKQLPALKPQNILIEPIKRNTAPAMALAAATIAKTDPQAIVISVWSDHSVSNPKLFAQIVAKGLKTVSHQPKNIVTIGIHPTTAHIGYGYIERGKLLEDDGQFSVFEVKRFVEKPDLKTAQSYLDQGTFYWNAGYFVWQAKHFLTEVKKYLPRVYQGVMKIQKDPTLLKKEFEKFPDLSVDTAIMEKTKQLVIPADLGWSDIGSWDAIDEILTSPPLALHIGIDTNDTLVVSDNPRKLISTIGTEKLIIVDTKDVLLVTKKGRSQEVKKVIEELKKRKLDHLL